MLINCWFDGACTVNPGGHAGWGAVVELPTKPNEPFPPKRITMSGYVGTSEGMTNNVAEYAGLIAVINKLVELQSHGRIEHNDQIVIHSDSRLVVEQMSGRWKRCSDFAYFDYSEAAIRGLKHVELGRVKFVWIPREQNMECDKLSKQVLINYGRKI